MNAAVMNDELKRKAFQFIVPHSAFIILPSPFLSREEIH
jgi:hypothetical protein